MKHMGRVDAIVRRLPMGSCVGAEIGVFRGDMSAALLRAHQHLTLLMVDSWWGTEFQSVAYRATRDMHAHLSQAQQDRNRRHALKATAFAGTRRAVLHMLSAEAVTHVMDGTLDFVFLDGDHSYDGVVQDIERWHPKLRGHGWLCGHDYSALYGPDKQYDFQVMAAVNDTVATYRWRLELDVDSTWFVHVGGGRDVE